MLSSGSWNSHIIFFFFCLSGCDAHVYMWSLPLGFLGFLLCTDLYPQPTKSYLVEERCYFKSYFFRYFPAFIFSPLLLDSNPLNRSLVFSVCPPDLVHFLSSLPSIPDTIFSVTLASRSFSFVASDAFVSLLGKKFPFSY